MDRKTWIETYTMTSPETCPTVEVLGVSNREPAYRDGRASLEVHYRARSRAPKIGEMLGTWMDGSTLYAMAPAE